MRKMQTLECPKLMDEDLMCVIMKEWTRSRLKWIFNMCNCLLCVYECESVVYVFECVGYMCVTMLCKVFWLK